MAAMSPSAPSRAQRSFSAAWPDIFLQSAARPIITATPSENSDQHNDQDNPSQSTHSVSFKLLKQYRNQPQSDRQPYAGCSYFFRPIILDYFVRLAFLLPP